MNMNQMSFDDIYGNYTLAYYDGTAYSSKDDFYFLKRYSNYSTNYGDVKKPIFILKIKSQKISFHLINCMVLMRLLELEVN